MRQAFAAAVLVPALAITGVMAWLLLGSDDAPAPTPATAVAETEDPVEPHDAEVERAAVESARAGEPAPPDPKASAAPDDPADDGSTDPEPVAPNLVLDVRGVRDGAPIRAFRYAFSHAGPTLRGEGAGGAARLAAPPATRGELAVEAAGHVPFRLELTTPAASAPARTIDVFLAEAGVATGIEIAAVDLAGAPVANVRVEAWRLPRGGELAGWHRGEPLWSRRAGDAEGIYVLPELEPGAYGIRLMATDAEGLLRPLLPFRRTFGLTGSNGFVERAVLEPGCVPGLELVDAAGRPLDPRALAIGVDLRLAGGPRVSRRWIQQNENGRFAADDAPPAPGACWLDEAVPGGLYRLTVDVAGDRRVDLQLALRAGERQLERVTVR